jgi:hypothetical protein
LSPLLDRTLESPLLLMASDTHAARIWQLCHREYTFCSQHSSLFQLKFGWDAKLNQQFIRLIASRHFKEGDERGRRFFD